jgi:hypothetical protein
MKFAEITSLVTYGVIDRRVACEVFGLGGMVPGNLFDLDLDSVTRSTK